MRVQTLLSRRMSGTSTTTSDPVGAGGSGSARIVIAPAAALLVAATLLTACSSSSDGPSRASGTAASGASTAPSSAASPPRGATGSASTQPAPKDTTARPVPHKTVKAPTAGTVDQQVAAEKVVTRPTVALDHSSKLGNGVTVELTHVRAMRATARIPGEVAGPAVAVTVEFVNHTSKSLPLDNVVLNVVGSDKTPGNQMSTSPAQPLRGTLAAGKSASGTYVFTLSSQHRDPVTVTVFYSTKAPTAVFAGPVK